MSGGRVCTSLYALHSGASEFLVGLMIGLYGLLPMALSLTVGRWVDRIGPFVPMRLGMFAVTLGIAAPAILPSINTLFITASLCGLGFMVVALSAQHAVGCLCHDAENRVAYFGWLALGHSASGILGPVIVGFAIDLFGFTAGFALLAVSAAISLLLVILNKAGLRSLHPEPLSNERHNVWTLVEQPTMRRIYIVGILVAISWDLFTFLMPILGHREHLSASAIGAILASFAVGTFSIRLVMARLATRFTEWQMLRAAIVIIVIVYLTLPIVQSRPLFFMLAFMLGASVGCSQPNMLSLLHAAAPPGRSAEAIGLRGMLANASMVAVPLLFGATAASVGLLPMFWTVAALVATALPVANRAVRD